MIEKQYPQATSMIKHGASHNDVIVCTTTSLCVQGYRILQSGDSLGAGVKLFLT